MTGITSRRLNYILEHLTKILSMGTRYLRATSQNNTRRWEGMNQILHLGSLLFLYVDNGAFPFATREEMTQGVTVIFDQFARFRLEMQLGYKKDGKIQTSKTECVFFSPPQ